MIYLYNFLKLKKTTGYLEDDARGTMICTAWIPLLDTSKANGGMGMAKRTQKRGNLGTIHSTYLLTEFTVGRFSASEYAFYCQAKCSLPLNSQYTFHTGFKTDYYYH